MTNKALTPSPGSILTQSLARSEEQTLTSPYPSGVFVVGFILGQEA